MCEVNVEFKAVIRKFGNIDNIPVANNIKNKINNKYGDYFIVGFNGINTNIKYSYKWIGRCLYCGKYDILSLNAANKHRCKCKLYQHRKKIDFTNYKFGYNCKINKFYKKNHKHYFWEATCGCGRIFIIQSTRIKNAKMCVKCCRNRSGHHIYNYNSNLTEQDRLKDRKKDYQNKKFIKDVFKRDNFQCQLCYDKTGGNLKAHHLDGWNWAKDKRYDVNNGITLCECCHKKFHQIYGYGDNTIEQFINFINNILNKMENIQWQ